MPTYDTRRCPLCGHDPSSSHLGVCTVVASTTGPGQNATQMTNVHEDGSPCGCTYFGTNSTCVKCGVAFRCAHSDFGKPEHPAHECYSCWYGGMEDAVAERFRPLKEPLERLLEMRLTIAQTGGFIMCLQVDLPRGFYAWFSEFYEDDAPMVGDVEGFGLYFWDEATDDDGGASRFVYDDSAPEWRRSNGEAIAEWAAPKLAQIAAEVAAGATMSTITVGEYAPL